jgi:hypothetical protein
VIKSKLAEPPDNLSPEDDNGKLLEKLIMNRLYLLQESLKESNPQVRVVTKNVERISRQDMTTRLSMCDLNTSVNYDVNRGTATAQAVCESYHVKSVYSVHTNKYEWSAYVQSMTGTKIGLRTVDNNKGALVFVEGSW